MSLAKIIKTTLVCASFAVMAPSLASALTINFDGASSGTPLVIGEYQFDVARIVSGNCASGDCLALNSNETSTLSRTDGGTFSLSSLWFKLLGAPSDLVISSVNPAGSVTINSPSQTGTTYTFLAGAFANVTSIMFANVGKGNIRIDDLNLTETPAAVPLPAGAGLLLAALGGLSLVRRRRAAK